MVGYQPDGKRKMKSFYGRTQKEVKEKAAKYLEDLRAAPQIGKEMYFSDWADVWYESMKGQVAEQTYESYQYTLNILKEHFRDDRLIDIRAIDIENFLKKMAEDGRSHSYITKFRGMLFQIMKKAEANDLIRKNPVAYADKQKNTGVKSEKDAFTAEEIRHLMKALPYDRMGMSIRLMLGTGMRTQEIMALEPKHIEEDGSCIHIRQAVTMVKGSPKIGPPKTKTSYRDIPVPSHLREIAKEFRNTSEQFRTIHLAWRRCSNLQSKRIPQAFQESTDRRREGQTSFPTLLPSHLCLPASSPGCTAGNHSEPDRARGCGYDGTLSACSERGQGRCGAETEFAVQKRKTDPSHCVRRSVQVQFKYGTVMVPDFYTKKLEKHRISF